MNSTRLRHRLSRAFASTLLASAAFWPESVAAATNDPPWSDAQGWSDVTHYSTIQAVGAGADLFLLARANAGMITLRYDRAANRWVDIAVNDPPWSDSQGWDDVSNYSTIQAVGAGNDLFLLARANAGMVTLRYNRATDRWVDVAVNDPPWSDSQGWDDFNNYSTIQAVGVGSDLFLLARANAGMVTLRYDRASDRWVDVAVNDPLWSDGQGWDDFNNYSTIQAVGAGNDLFLLARANAGMVTLRYNHAIDRWVDVAVNDPPWSDGQGWDDVSNYSTIQAVGGGNDLFLLARANAGMVTLRYNRATDRWVDVAVNDPPWSDGQGWDDVTNYSTIQAVGGGTDLFLLARANAGMVTLRYDRATDRWMDVAVNDPLWSDSQGWNDVSNYATIRATGAGGDLYLLGRANAGMVSLRYDRSTDAWTGVPLARHSLVVSRWTGTALTPGDVDRIFRDATIVLQVIDGPGDVPCFVELMRSGDVRVFTAGDGSIDTAAELSTIFGQSGNIKVVNDVNFCENKFNTSFIGCGQISNPSFIIERFTTSLEGILWAHEFGHNRGLGHREDTTDALMYRSIGSNRRRVNAGECGAFRGGARFALGPLVTMPQDDAAQAVTAFHPVIAFVTQLYFDGLPLDRAAAFGSDAVPPLVRLLGDGDQVVFHENAALTLGMIGADSAIEPLVAYLERPPAADGTGQGDGPRRAGFKGRVGAIIGLGYLANRARSRRALSYLMGRADPATLPMQPSPSGFLPPHEAEELRKYAIIALGLSGNREARDFLRTLRERAPALPGLTGRIRGIIDQSLALNDEISRLGLVRYYRRREP